MYNEKALNTVQTWLAGFSAMCRYTTFGMASARGSFTSVCNFHCNKTGYCANSPPLWKRIYAFRPLCFIATEIAHAAVKDPLAGFQQEIVWQQLKTPDEPLK
jgi:hypothetical protein